MRRLHRFFIHSYRSAIAVALLLSVSSGAQAAPSRPAFLDFSTISPAAGEECRSLDLSGTALRLALLALTREEQVLVSGITAVQAQALPLDSSNRAAVQRRLTDAHARLAKAGWSRMAVPKSRKGQSVAMFAHARSGASMDAVAITAMEDAADAVIVYATGDLTLSQVKQIAARLRIDELRERLELP